MIFGRILSLVLCSISMLTTASAAGLASSSPFKLIDNRVFVSARLDGQGPYSFLLDTGADGWTVSAKASRRLALAQGAAEQIEGVGEAKDTVHQLTLKEVTLGGLSFADQPAVSEDFSALDEVIGFRHFDGIAGKPVFDHYVVDLDFTRSRVRFFPPAAYSIPPDAIVMPFKLYDGVMPIMEGEIGGAKGLFVVDLGDRSSLTLFGPFWRAHHLDRAFGPGIIALTGYGVGGPVKGELVRVSEFVMAGVRVRGVVARLSLQKAGAFGTSAIAGSIGTGILKRFGVAFDYPQRRIVLHREPGGDVPDPADRSGLWLGRHRGEFAVFDVIPRSPADLSGIKKGDVITAIDGAPAQRLDLFAVREELKSSARKAVFLTIERDARASVVRVQLHDLIPN
jgi:hypothetical protein